jgi:hypothetical protein
MDADGALRRRKKKPFLFGMGKDFLMPESPMVWHKLLHDLSVH